MRTPYQQGLLYSDSNFWTSPKKLQLQCKILSLVMCRFCQALELRACHNLDGSLRVVSRPLCCLICFVIVTGLVHTVVNFPWTWKWRIWERASRWVDAIESGRPVGRCGGEWQWGVMHDLVRSNEEKWFVRTAQNGLLPVEISKTSFAKKLISKTYFMNKNSEFSFIFVSSWLPSSLSSSTVMTFQSKTTLKTMLQCTMAHIALHTWPLPKVQEGQFYNNHPLFF